MKRYSSVLLISCLLFIACDTLHNPSSGVQNGYGTVRIALLGGEERTAFPSFAFDRIEYAFTKTGEVPITLEPDSRGLFTLEAGEWQVTVNAYTTVGGSDTLAATGVSEAFTLKGGAALNIAIPLTAATATGIGSFSYTISYPPGTTAEWSLTNLIDSNPVNLNPVAQGNAISQTLAIPAGYYLFNIRLRNGSRLAGINEAIHIYPLAATKFERTFGDAVFSHNTIFPEDFAISGTGTFAYDGSPKTVAITVQPGKSPGTIAIYYEGIISTTYSKNATPPSDPGTYLVTFDVAAAPGWAATSGLVAGMVLIRGDGALISAPTSYSSTHTSITVDPVSPPANGQTVEYAINTVDAAPLTGWQDGVTFSDLSPATTYYILARSKENAVYYAGAVGSGLYVITNIAPGAAVDAPTLASKTETSITVNAVAAPGNGQSVEYGISPFNSTEPSYGNSLIFNGLTPGTTYYVWARSTASGAYDVGIGVCSAAITTDKYAGATILVSATLASRTDTSITINAATLAGSTGQGIEYAISTTNTAPSAGWQDGVVFSTSLNPDTSYYIFARSKEDNSYAAGTPSTGLAVTTYLISPTGITLAWIPAGTFTMGSPDGNGGTTNEAGRILNEIQHEVTLTSGFYMGVYEVTQDEWFAVMGSNPSGFNSNPESGETQGKRPVEQVSFYDAMVFCNTLSMNPMEGLTPAYSINGSTNPSDWGSVPTGSNNGTWDAAIIVPGSTGYRLPTEAQWEYACRAGTTTAFNDGFTNLWSDSAVELLGWYSTNAGSITHEVGKKTANTWGLYDMHGNVYEWCWDWGGDYPASHITDPTGDLSGTSRVLRGSYWSQTAQYARSAMRGGNPPYYRMNYIGLRVVRP